jgi:hypothetical protein
MKVLPVAKSGAVLPSKIIAGGLVGCSDGLVTA